MSYANIIGRVEEIATLERLYNSTKSEFVAIYGRRRVGKSYLVSEVFAKKTLVGYMVKVEKYLTINKILSIFNSEYRCPFIYYLYFCSQNQRLCVHILIKVMKGLKAR